MLNIAHNITTSALGRGDFINPLTGRRTHATILFALFVGLLMSILLLPPRCPVPAIPQAAGRTGDRNPGMTTKEVVQGRQLTTEPPGEVKKNQSPDRGNGEALATLNNSYEHPNTHSYSIPTEGSVKKQPRRTDPKALGPKKFSVSVRGIAQTKEEAIEIGPGAAVQVFKAALKLDVTALEEPVIEWRDREVVAMDLDVPAGEEGIEDHDIDSFFPKFLPRPLFAWRSHGGGLRAIFLSRALAGIWALLSPLRRLASWRMEVLTHTRHPSGERNGQVCSPVHYYKPSSHFELPGSPIYTKATDAERQAWLEEHGLSYGRYSADRCPKCQQKTSGSDPVLISEWGMHCFHCDSHWSWDMLVGHVVQSGRATLSEAAWHFVHFPHQKHVLHHIRPSVSESLLQPAWESIVNKTHESYFKSLKGKDKIKFSLRLERTIKPSRVDIVRSSSGDWLDARDFQHRKVSVSGARDIPCVRSATDVDRVLATGKLPGFVPLYPVNAETVIGPYVEPPDGSILVRRPAASDSPGSVDIDSRPSEEEVKDARHNLEKQLPGLDLRYLSVLVVTGLYAQRKETQPPIVVVTGPTGTGKTATQHLAAAMLGGLAAPVSMRDSDNASRQIGLGLESGAQLLFADEIGRVEDLYLVLEVVLSLGATMQFAAKYANERIVAVTAPLSLISSSLPNAIVQSPELARRAVGIELTQKAKSWDHHGNLSFVRKNEDLRPHLDVLTRDLWWVLFDEGERVDWRALCMERFGAVPVTSLNFEAPDRESQHRAIRALYAFYRELPDESIVMSGTRKGWGVISEPDQKKCLAELIDMDAPARVQGQQAKDLGQVDLSKVLGFESPALDLMIRRHGRGDWVFKFRVRGVKNGHEPKRGTLPEASLS